MAVKQTGAERALAGLRKTLEAQERDLATVAKSKLSHNRDFAQDCREAIARTQSAIRKIQDEGLPDGYETRWNEDEHRRRAPSRRRR